MLLNGIAAGVTRVRSGTFRPTTGGRSAASAHLPSQTNLYAEQVWRREVGPDTQGQDHAGRQQFEFTFDAFTATSSPTTTGSARKPSLFHNRKSHSYAWTYHITAMRRLLFAPAVVHHRRLFAIKTAATLCVMPVYARGSTIRQ